MNTNKFICLIIGILTGFLAKAEEMVPASGHANNYINAVRVTPDDANRHLETHASYKCKIPEQKTSKIRQRFRGVSFFTSQPINTPAQAVFTYYNKTTRLSTGNYAFTLPFYYIFLFRLTPF